jgi:cell division septum initiation protein DivIVA
MTDQTNNLQSAADAKVKLARGIKDFVAVFKGLDAFSDELLEVGALQEHAAKAKAFIASAKAEFETLKAEKVKAESAIADAKAEGDEILAAANAGAKQILDKAHADAREVEAKAKAAADEHDTKAAQAKYAAAAAVGARENAMADVQKAKDEQARIEQLIASMKARF